MDFSAKCSILILVLAVGVLLACLASAQPTPCPVVEASPARALDAELQDYAFRAFRHPRTGVIYDATVPSDLSGVAIAAVRLRSGSLRRYGVANFKEFNISTGVIVQPYVERLVLVYQNLGNFSEHYYPLNGYTYLAPVLGLLPYSADNLSAIGLRELELTASAQPILITFSNVSPAPDGAVAKCVWFDLNGVPQFKDLVSSIACSTFRMGHFSIVTNFTALTPAGATTKSKSKSWRIAVAVVGGVVGLVLIGLVVLWIIRQCRTLKLRSMEKRAEGSEVLRVASVGRTQAPAALPSRTQPSIENEYIP